MNSNPSLSELQRFLKSAVAHPENQDELSPTSFKIIDASGSLEKAKERIGIYANAYFCRIHEILKLDFPHLLSLLGEDSFEKLARDYMNSFPSKTFTLSDYGKDLPPFVESEFGPATGEVATLDWSIAQNYFFDLDTLADVEAFTGDAQSIPVLSPTAEKLTLKWNILDFWDDLSPQVLPQLERKLTTLVVFRNLEGAQLVPLDVMGEFLFDSIGAGYTLQKIGESLVERSDLLLEKDIGTYFSQWVPSGLIAGFRRL